MLGLGVSLGAGSVISGAWTPETLSNLQLWLKFNQNITADQNSSGGSITHSTSAGDMGDADKINAWNAFGDTSVNAVQATQADKPVWETDTADVGGVKFNGSKILEFSADVVLDADTDFTIAIRFKCVDLSTPKAGLLGGAGTNEFLKLTSNTNLRAKITDGGSTNNRDFTLASGNLEDDEYFTIIVVRSDGSTGNMNTFIRGNESLDGTATGTQMGSQLADAGEVTIKFLGVTHDEGGNLNGFVKDVLIWDGTAASSGDRKEIFDYIEGQ